MADPWSKAKRLQAFLDLLEQLPAAASHTEALRQLGNALDAVEDRHSGVPYDPANWQSDGRMYPPSADSHRPVPGHPSVARYRNRAHNTFLGRNGVIEIRRVRPGSPPQDGEVLLSKPGADGRTVWHQEPGDP